MSDQKLGSLYYDLVAKDSLTAKLKQVESQAGKTAKALNTIGSGMTKYVTAPILGGLTAIAGAAIMSVRKMAEFGEQMNRLHQITGLSTDSLQKYSHIVKYTGGDFLGFTNSITMLERKLPGIQSGSGPAADAIKKLGLAAVFAKSSTMSWDAQVGSLISTLQGMPDIAERNALALQLFGRNAKEVMNIAGLTAAQMKKFGETGVIFTPEQLKAADDFGDTLDELNIIFQDTVSALGQGLIPSLREKLVPALKSLVPVLQGTIGVGVKSLEFFLALPNPIKAATVALVAMLAAVGPLATGLGSIISLGGKLAGLTTLQSGVAGLAGAAGGAVGAGAVGAVAAKAAGAKVLSEYVKKAINDDDGYVRALAAEAAAMAKSATATTATAGALTGGLIPALIAAAPYVLALAAAGGIAYAAYRSLRDRTIEDSQASLDNAKVKVEQADRVRSLVAEYKRLESQSSLTKEEATRLKKVMEEIAVLMPEAVTGGKLAGDAEKKAEAYYKDKSASQKAAAKRLAEAKIRDIQSSDAQAAKMEEALVRGSERARKSGGRVRIGENERGTGGFGSITLRNTASQAEYDALTVALGKKRDALAKSLTDQQSTLATLSGKREPTVVEPEVTRHLMDLQIAAMNEGADKEIAAIRVNKQREREAIELYLPAQKAQGLASIQAAETKEIAAVKLGVLQDYNSKMAALASKDKELFDKKEADEKERLRAEKERLHEQDRLRKEEIRSYKNYLSKMLSASEGQRDSAYSALRGLAGEKTGAAMDISEKARQARATSALVFRDNPQARASMEAAISKAEKRDLRDSDKGYRLQKAETLAAGYTKMGSISGSSDLWSATQSRLGAIPAQLTLGKGGKSQEDLISEGNAYLKQIVAQQTDVIAATKARQATWEE